MQPGRLKKDGRKKTLTKMIASVNKFATDITESLQEGIGDSRSTRESSHV
jgi:hypothetical protein